MSLVPQPVLWSTYDEIKTHRSMGADTLPPCPRSRFLNLDISHGQSVINPTCSSNRRVSRFSSRTCLWSFHSLFSLFFRTNPITSEPQFSETLALSHVQALEDCGWRIVGTDEHVKGRDYVWDEVTRLKNQCDKVEGLECEIDLQRGNGSHR